MKKMAILLSLLLCGLVLGGAKGCVTTSQGNELSSELEQLTGRMDALEKDHQSMKSGINSTAGARGDLFADVDLIKSELQKLQGAIEQARYDAAHAKELTVEMQATIDANLSYMEARLRVAESKLGIESSGGDVAVIPAEVNGGGGKEVPANDKDAYEQAYRVYQTGQFQSAREKSREFLKAYSRSKYAGNAQFWIGETYYRQRDYENAILEYDKVITQFPSSNKIAAAYLKMGFSFLELGESEEAKAFFERVVTDFPSTEQAAIAKRKLETLQ